MSLRLKRALDQDKAGWPRVTQFHDMDVSAAQTRRSIYRVVRGLLLFEIRARS
jgi:hypothetical protein